MPKGVPFRDFRLENAVRLYLQVWPEAPPERALDHVQAGVKQHGIKEATRRLQAALEDSGRKREHNATKGESDV